MQENSENIPENPPGTPPPAPEPAPPPPPPQAAEEVPVPQAPEPKRRGRPEGAKDRAPRKKKAVTIIVEEHIQPPEAAPVATPTNPARNPEDRDSEPPPPPPPSAADSPRTLIRDASEHILKLKNVTRLARKAHLQETYAKRLHSLS